MFFNSLPVTVFIVFIVALVGYGIYLLLKKEGSRELNKREYIGFTIVIVLVICGAIYAFTTNFGAY